MCKTFFGKNTLNLRCRSLDSNDTKYLLFKNKLETLTFAFSKYKNFTFDVCVASENSSWPQKGYVTDYIEPSDLNDGDVDIYLCGPPPMVEAVSSFMQEVGIQPVSLHYEKFTTSK